MKTQVQTSKEETSCGQFKKEMEMTKRLWRRPLSFSMCWLVWGCMGNREGHLKISCDGDNNEKIFVHEFKLEKFHLRVTGF